MSSGLGSTSNAVKPSTSSSSLDWNFATKVAGPAYGGVYLKVHAATPPGGISAIWNRFLLFFNLIIILKEKKGHLKSQSFVQSRSFDIENPFFDWYWQWIFKTNNNINRLFGNCFALELEFDIRLSHTEVILSKVIVVCVLDLGRAGYVESRLKMYILLEIMQI